MKVPDRQCVRVQHDGDEWQVTTHYAPSERIFLASQQSWIDGAKAAATIIARRGRDDSACRVVMTAKKIEQWPWPDDSIGLHDFHTTPLDASCDWLQPFIIEAQGALQHCEAIANA
jgi:hypothetical protein